MRRRYGRPAVLGIHLVKGRRKLGQGPIHHGFDAPDRMALWDQGVEALPPPIISTCRAALPLLDNLPVDGI